MKPSSLCEFELEFRAKQVVLSIMQASGDVVLQHPSAALIYI